jgi:hypothetical protein
MATVLKGYISHVFTAPNTYLALLNDKAYNNEYFIPVRKVLP